MYHYVPPPWSYCKLLPLPSKDVLSRVLNSRFATHEVDVIDIYLALHGTISVGRHA
jgi:hypothetical protein